MKKAARHNRKQVAERIRQHKKFLVSGHERLDGDSVGSAYAVAAILRKLGKEVYLAHNAQVPSKYRFLSHPENVPATTREAPSDVDCIITVDCPDTSREAVLNAHFPGGVEIINIDHHTSNHMYGDLNWIDGKAAAVGEMIYDLARELKVAMDPVIATGIYVSIVTDTGRFGYSCVRPKTHAIAAKLLKHGVPLERVNQEVYQNRVANYWQLAMRALQGLRVECGGRLAYVFLRQKDFQECAYEPEESQDFVEFPLSIKGSQMAMYLRETKNGNLKISFRSKTDAIDVNKLAAQFGGGGHSRAAGAVTPGPVEDALTRVVDASVRAVENAG